MVRMLECSFCGRKIPPGSALVYAKNDGSILRFCSRKCKVNMLSLNRNPHRLKWTAKYTRSK